MGSWQQVGKILEEKDNMAEVYTLMGRRSQLTQPNKRPATTFFIPLATGSAACWWSSALQSPPAFCSSLFDSERAHMKEAMICANADSYTRGFLLLGTTCITPAQDNISVGFPKLSPAQVLLTVRFDA